MLKQVVLAVASLLAGFGAAHAQERVAIRSSLFSEEIVVLKSAWGQVNREFALRLGEVNDLSARIDRASAEVERLQRSGAPATPENEAKVEAVIQLRAQLSRKTDEYQAEWDRRTQQVVGPVAKKVEDAMSDYLASRGVKEVFDLDAGDQPPPGTPNISSDFIAWFNANR